MAAVLAVTGTTAAQSKEALKKEIIRELETGTIARLYRNSYRSLCDRMLDDGYMDESLTGTYGGEYVCTAGAFSALAMETGDLPRAERALTFVFESMRRHGIDRIPHILGRVEAGKEQYLGTDDQADIRARIVAEYASYCTLSGNRAFQDKYYDIVRKELFALLDQPYMYYLPHGKENEWASFALGIVLNCSFEHSREYRRWSVFDILTQSYVGAAASRMLPLAKARGDGKLVRFIEERLPVLEEGIDRYMTREVDGRKVYLEMRIPDGNWGRPYLGMGWLNFAPIPAQWEALDRQVLVNTVDLLKERLYVSDPLDPSVKFLSAEYDENGDLGTYWVLTKGVGWYIDFCRQEERYESILEWFRFYDRLHADKDLVCESMGFHDGKWVMSDNGNGEQNSWWCWAIARLRKEMGLNPVLE